MPFQSTQKQHNILKAHAVARDHLRRASYLFRQIHAQLLDSLLGVSSGREDSPMFSQRHDDEQYLNVFLNQDDFDTAVLQHLSDLISQLATSRGWNEREQNNCRVFQLTYLSIKLYQGP